MNLRAGEVAEAAGVNRETLRYYERRGLLGDPGRSPGGHRLYDERAVATLMTIKAAQLAVNRREGFMGYQWGLRCKNRVQ